MSGIHRAQHRPKTSTRSEWGVLTAQGWVNPADGCIQPEFAPMIHDKAVRLARKHCGVVYERETVYIFREYHPRTKECVYAST